MEKHTNYAKNPEAWLEQVVAERSEKCLPLLHTALHFHEGRPTIYLEKALAIADTLFRLKLDNETVAVALAYPMVQAREIHLDTITEALGESSKKLLQDVLQMQSLSKFQDLSVRNHYHIENLRKMMLAMVSDVRAILIILAERLWNLHQAKKVDPQVQQELAHETIALYAPLANRLGVWQLKWEIEDLCLRYLEPDNYSNIAKLLAAKRTERELYIEKMKDMLANLLTRAQIKNFQVTGRVKHIYSIYKKMQRKNATFDDIYDISALRVLVPEIDDCYAVLGLLQDHWPQVHDEFDDYIMQPKPNGYRSIHTVIKGPDDRFVEIQIRTHQMHQESELGVAAHWRYKEGMLQTSSYEAKIALLRQVMEWQKEVAAPASAATTQPAQDVFADHIYVFTPMGDIMDLEKGATPLDFAYHIHSEVGHRCRGAKVNGRMVPLTYELQTGERVEVLTAKQANPSRDWVNPHYGYLKTSRARAKVAHWFRVQDNAKITAEESDTTVTKPEPELPSASSIPYSNAKHIPSHIQILGVNNLLTTMARCCRPLPGDDIIGYITQNRGISIHRKNCPNIMAIDTEQQLRLIDVEWGSQQTQTYPVDFLIRAIMRSGLTQEITDALQAEKIKIINLQNSRQVGDEVDVYLTIEINNIKQLQTITRHLQRVTGVLKIQRR